MNPGQRLLSTFKVKDYLTPKIWDYVEESGVYILRKDVRNKLFLATNEFLDFFNQDILKEQGFIECNDDNQLSTMICLINRVFLNI